MLQKIRILATLLLLVTGTASAALAQEDEGSAPPAQGNTVEPKNPAPGVYENGALVVISTVKAPEDCDNPDAKRDYGYRIGDRMCVELTFIAAPNVAVNTDNLARGNFDPDNGSDLVVAGPAQVFPIFQQEGKLITVVRLSLRTWVTMKDPRQVVFNSVFLYATKVTRDGNPDWKKAMTPNLVIQTSRTVGDNSKDLDEGDKSLRQPPASALVQPLAYTSNAIYGVVGAIIVIILLRFFWPTKTPRENEVAWQVFTRILADSTPEGISYRHTVDLAGALRTYLKVPAVTDDTELEFALRTFFEPQGENRYELARVGTEAFRILDKALYAHPENESDIALTPDRARELFAHIKRLVPRP
jgi:hypothetical protein